jgi:NAD(P)-dependent dehydrogenase (short-subunit alcohol dehydrogenase family)
MTDATDRPAASPEVALIVGGGPGISASCARLFAQNHMRVAVAARDPDKPVLQALEASHGVRRFGCDAADPAAVAQLFQNVVGDIGAPTLVVHNIDGRVAGIFRKTSPKPIPAWSWRPCGTPRSARSWSASRPPA